MVVVVIDVTESAFAREKTPRETPQRAARARVRIGEEGKTDMTKSVNNGRGTKKNGEQRKIACNSIQPFTPLICPSLTPQRCIRDMLMEDKAKEGPLTPLGLQRFDKTELATGCRRDQTTTEGIHANAIPQETSESRLNLRMRQDLIFDVMEVPTARG